MANMTRQQRRYNKNPLRRKIPGVGAQNRPTVRTPITNSTAVVNAMTPTIVLTFDSPCFWTGQAPFPTLSSGDLILSGENLTANTIRVTCDGVVPAATTLTWPFECPSVRNTAGGYVRTPIVLTT